METKWYNLKEKKFVIRLLFCSLTGGTLIFLLFQANFGFLHDDSFLKPNRIDARLKKWSDVGTMFYLADAQNWYEHRYLFPSLKEMEELIRARLTQETYLKYQDSWGNPIFYYNGRKEGNCVWIASPGPDRKWFTGSKDPRTIIDKINELSVENEFKYYLSNLSESPTGSWHSKCAYLIISDDHIIFADVTARYFYTRDMKKISLLQGVRERLQKIGSYESYRNLYQDRCIVENFLESAVHEDSSQDIGVQK